MTPALTHLRKLSRRAGEPLNILCIPTHERVESNIARTGHEFWAFRGPWAKPWNSTFAHPPANYHFLPPAESAPAAPLPLGVPFDLVLAQSRFGQFQALLPLARALQLPIMTIEHTFPHPSWGTEVLDGIKKMRGHVDCFISRSSRDAWGWGEEGRIVHHGVDTDVFSPNDLVVDKKKHVLSVANDFNHPNRQWCIGFDFWQRAVKEPGLPWRHVGTSEGDFSRPARSVPDLVREYRECAVFCDTASHSPLPTVLIEAMSCGAVCVSRGNGMVPEVIRDGENGFLCPTPGAMHERLSHVLSHPEEYERIRENARDTIVERFSLAAFVANWDSALREAASKEWEWTCG